MSKILITQGGGGILSDDCTASKNEVLKGYSTLTSDSDDEIIEGTLELTGDAVENHVLQGESFYSNDPKTKLTGTLVINSLLSFSVAAYSGKRLLATWTNPQAADGKPYSGVYIRYNTGSYPGKTGGTQIYKGVGNNTTSGADSSVYLDLPAVGTTYYFSIYPYVTTSLGEMTGDVLNATRATSGQSNVSITSTRSYTVPTGYTKMDVFCVGGGGGGYNGSETSGWDTGGGGGGGGYTKTVTGIVVSGGQSLYITVGSGGRRGIHSSGIEDVYQQPTDGGTSSVTRSGSVLCSATGGHISNDPDYGYGGSGGSGGGDGADALNHNRIRAGRGGSNGSNGSGTGDYDEPYDTYGGTGQHTTTRAWGSGSGTLYSGGGGGGPLETYMPGPGGAGGGGSGGTTAYSAGAGGTNTGGGGGGGRHEHYGSGGNGGSGIVLLRFY